MASSHSIFVTWPRPDSSFSGKLSSVAALMIEREQNSSTERENNAYTFTWVFLDKPVAECFAQGICSLLHSQGAKAVTGMSFLVTMSGGLGSAASQPLCFPSSTCHLSSSHPIRCIYLWKKGLPMNHIINILEMRNLENTGFF